MVIANWRIYAASGKGKGHIDNGTPCQDAYAHDSYNGRLVAVVCDGAGSASHSDIGALNCAQTISKFLAEHSGDPEHACERSVIEQAVSEARSIIEARAKELSLPSRELGCTLLGAVLYENGGCMFHIGDGVGLVEFDTAELPTLSLPENGEYANETYFVTQDDWRAHLRLTPFSGVVCCLALMSDGAMSFAFNRERTGWDKGLLTVKSYLSTVDESKGSNDLKDFLERENTYKITSDDKTLLLVLPREVGS